MKPRARQKARHLLLQGLYQWELTQHNLTVIERELLATADESKLDSEFLREVLHQLPPQCAELDELLLPMLDRPVAELGPIELTILRMGAYELKNRLDVPYRVVINEAVELAKKFGATDSHKYINGVLDKLAKTLRQAEVMGRNNAS